MNTKRILWISGGVAGALICLAVLLFSIAVLWISHLDRTLVNEERTQLLCKTDHAAILRACRDLMARVRSGELKAGAYHIRYMRRSEVTSSFPQAILDLDPLTVYLDTLPPSPYVDIDAPPAFIGQRVYLEVQGWHSHRFGAIAYSEDYSGDPEGDLELIDGLWYYDDHYAEDSKCRQRVNALIQKCTREN